MPYKLETILQDVAEDAGGISSSHIVELVENGRIACGQKLRLSEKNNTFGQSYVLASNYEGEILGALPNVHGKVVSSLLMLKLPYSAIVSGLIKNNSQRYQICVQVEIQDSLEENEPHEVAAGTIINPIAVENSGTIINSELQNDDTGRVEDSTLINGIEDNITTIAPGTLLCDVYEVVEPLNNSSGEASLYICTFAARKYVAKVYKRKLAIKQDVVNQWSQIRSLFVAKLFAVGEYHGFLVEIIPYYVNGSLSGKTFSFDQLKYEIIPSINEGLHVLHDHGIIHKDIKPSNLMLNNDGRTAAIIDFGISSVRDKESTVLVTKTGLTPEYSAPETFRNLFLFESDYYSFGVTLYELYCGHSPYSNLDQEAIEKFLSIQKLPMPEDMDQELRNLIDALTYPDITNRHDRANPNRRWGYEEVANWCNDVPQPIPGAKGSYNSFDQTTARPNNTPNNENLGLTENMPPYQFGGKTITSRSQLVDEMNALWDEGKKHLFRGLLLSHFKKTENAELISHLMDYEEEAESSDLDTIFFRCLYSINPCQKSLLWKGEVYFDLADLGKRYLSAIRSGDVSFEKTIDELLDKGILSLYLSITDKSASDQIQVLQSIETKYKVLGYSERSSLTERYRTAYILSDVKDYVINGNTFTDFNQLSDHIIKEYQGSSKTLDSVCNPYILSDNGSVDIQYLCWMEAIGKSTEIEALTNDSRIIFFQSMYALVPDFNKISWRETEFSDLKDLGNQYLSALRNGNQAIITLVEELLTNHLLSRFLYHINIEKGMIDKLISFECDNRFTSGKPNKLAQYQLAYFLSESKELVIDSVSFSNIDELVAYIHQCFSHSHQTFVLFCSQLIKDGELSPIFESWLEAIGLSDSISRWQKGEKFNLMIE